MINWYYKVFMSYLKQYHNFNEEKSGYLILDKATSHLGKDFIGLLYFVNQEVSFIPGGMTRLYQPIDVSINEPFKTTLREKYINFCIDFGANNIKIILSNMIKFICDTWYSDIIKTKEIIWKNFKVIG